MFDITSPETRRKSPVITSSWSRFRIASPTEVAVDLRTLRVRKGEDLEVHFEALGSAQESVSTMDTIEGVLCRRWLT